MRCKDRLRPGAACTPALPEGFYGDFVRKSNSPDIGLSPCRFILRSVFDRMRCLPSSRVESWTTHIPDSFWMSNWQRGD